MAAKEEFHLTEDNLKEVLYMSDIDPNEACLHAMLKDPVLVVLFKMFDTDDRNFVSESQDLCVNVVVSDVSLNLNTNASMNYITRLKDKKPSFISFVNHAKSPRKHLPK